MAQHQTTNAQEVQARESYPQLNFPKSFIFIRSLEAKDEAALVLLYATAEVTGDRVRPKYGVFDGENRLIGAYTNVQEPFDDTVGTQYVLQWMH